LIPQAARVLKPGGWLMLEIGYGQSSALRNLMHGWSGVTLVNDLQGIPRVVLGQKQSATLK
jgi:release factor glutamine methyltransferase